MVYHKNKGTSLKSANVISHLSGIKTITTFVCCKKTHIRYFISIDSSQSKGVRSIQSIAFTNIHRHCLYKSFVKQSIPSREDGRWTFSFRAISPRNWFHTFCISSAIFLVALSGGVISSARLLFMFCCSWAFSQFASSGPLPEQFYSMDSGLHNSNNFLRGA